MKSVLPGPKQSHQKIEDSLNEIRSFTNEQSVQWGNHNIESYLVMVDLHDNIVRGDRV